MSETPSFLVIPFAQLTPEACGVVAARVAAARQRLIEIGISAPMSRRLLHAESRLRRVAKENSYGATTLELRETAEAINLAGDFFQVAGVLGDNPGATIRQELTTALAADLVPSSSHLGALNFQTQYWFGMVLAKAGFRPKVPAKRNATAHVDFEIELDSVAIGVEIKRPQHIASARDAMDRGAGQLRSFGLPGVLVLDLSSCLGQDQLVTGALDHPVPIKHLVTPHFRRIASRLADRPRRYNQSDKYARLIATVFYARVFGWQRFDMSEPHASILGSTDQYGTACSGLLQDKTARFCAMVRSALGDVAGTVPEQI